ncbi:MAG: hypothetical protein H8E16_09525 [Flavobacteriales bacterium]|nr:hypothetical protein [Flavobacteriales bacterium]
MMLVDNKFELEIPTHIAFTLYKNDYIDNLIISKVKKECKNESKKKNEFIVSLEEFQNAIRTSTFLRAELKKTSDQDLLPNPNFKPNSIFFIQSIINRLANLNKITFKISDEKIFSRLVKVDGGREIVSFHFNIIEGTFDLTKILDRVQLDTFNKRFMDVGIMKNKYLERISYFYIKATILFDILSEMDEAQVLDAFEIITSVDPKIEEDDPILLVKTDYTPY